MKFTRDYVINRLEDGEQVLYNGQPVYAQKNRPGVLPATLLTFADGAEVPNVLFNMDGWTVQEPQPDAERKKTLLEQIRTRNVEFAVKRERMPLSATPPVRRAITLAGKVQALLSEVESAQMVDGVTTRLRELDAHAAAERLTPETERMNRRMRISNALGDVLLTLDLLAAVLHFDLEYVARGAFNAAVEQDGKDAQV